MRYLNIFESSFRLPAPVCIVAPGPHGRPYYRDIPREFLIMAVAKAVLIPEIKPDVWMMNHADQSWYEEADARFKGTRIFGDEAAGRRPAPLDGRSHYYFRPAEEALQLEMREGVDGVVRLGGSIAGCALQIAYNFGAREVILCGVDMSGDDYWDGTHNSSVAHGETWSTIQRLDPLIYWMQEKGISITTLSPTKLDVPVRKSNAVAPS